MIQLKHTLWVEPRCYIGGGGSSGKFKRKGTGVHVRNYGVPANINKLVTDNVNSSVVDPTLAQKQTTLFGNLMEQTAEDQPGYSQLAGFANLSPTDYSGRSTLFNVAARNPYSSEYEAATTNAYRQRASDAMASVASGPDAVRGGDARTGVLQGVTAERLAAGRGQEVRNAQLQDLAGVIQAATSMGQIENTRTEAALRAALGASGLADGVAGRGLEAGKQVDMSKLQNLSLLQLAAQMQGTTNDTQTDDFKGEGSQDGWQAGLSCCFLFFETLGSPLPWYIELARHEFITPTRKVGYRWMSSWLVPAMRKWKLCKWLVEQIIIKPFCHYGAWFYGEETESETSALYAPYCQMWLNVWSTIGVIYGRIPRLA